MYTVLVPGGNEETHDVVNPSYAEAVADGARVPAQDELVDFFSYDSLLLQVQKTFIQCVGQKGSHHPFGGHDE